MSNPVVVTGAAGFVGQALLSVLRRSGVPVIGVTRSRRPQLTIVSDYAQTPAPEGATLVHLAQARDASAPCDSSQIAVCRALVAMPWRHIIYASSAVVYGDGSGHLRQPDEPVSPASDYARLKLACEDIVGAAGGTSLRLANLYGPGMGTNTVVADILRQIPGAEPLRLRDPAPVRDFLWIEDAARCVAAACALAPGGILNAGSGVGVAVGELARLALTLAGEAGRPVVGKDTAADASTLVLDIEETRALLRWSPQTDLRSGLSALLNERRHAQ